MGELILLNCHIVKTSYRFNATPIKILMKFITNKKKKILKFVSEGSVGKTTELDDFVGRNKG